MDVETFESLRQAPALPGETLAVPLKRRLGHVGLPSAAAGCLGWLSHEQSKIGGGLEVIGVVLEVTGVDLEVSGVNLEVISVDL